MDDIPNLLDFIAPDIGAGASANGGGKNAARTDMNGGSPTATGGAREGARGPDRRALANGAHRRAPSDGAPLRRNDTSFPTQMTAKLRALYDEYRAARADVASPRHRLATALKYYQYLVRTVMSNPEYGIGADGNARGLLIYHTMGMGKTRCAVAVAMALWDTRPPVVMLARALQKNFLETVKEVVELLQDADTPPEELSRLKTEAVARFTFVSMDAYNSADQMARVGTGATRVKRGDLTGATGGIDGKHLIVDEAHNFFRAIINSSAENANARRVYDMTMLARNLRITFLTGTPAAKNPFELVPCFNMLAGSDLLPTQYDSFNKLYVDRERHAVRNRNYLANRIVGLVSHVTHSRPTDPPLEPSDSRAAPRRIRDDGWFPEERQTIIERVEMGADQYRQYLLAREKELAEGKGGEGGPRAVAIMSAPPLALPGSEKKAMGTYYVKSRMLSNFAPPRDWVGTPVDRMPDSVFEASVGPKLDLIARRADEAPGPVLVYSQFISAGGLLPMSRYLRRRGFTEWRPPTDARPTGAPPTDARPTDAPPTDARPTDARPTETGPLTDARPTETGPLTDARPTDAPPTDARPTETGPPQANGGSARKVYAVISGDVDPKVRDLIKEAFNARANIHGGVIKALLVSKTGAEGLDLKNIRETHQLEPYWDKARDDQVKSRAVRIGSHDDLPRAEREVQPYLYIAVANRAVWDQMLKSDREEMTIDEQFAHRADSMYETCNAFRQLLAEVCLECELFGYGGCRTCVPTGAPLFRADPALDVRLPDPCEVRRETEVEATPLRVDGETYYYMIDPGQPLGFRFFAFRKDLGGYAPVDPGDEDIPRLLQAIEAGETAGGPHRGGAQNESETGAHSERRKKMSTEAFMGSNPAPAPLSLRLPPPGKARQSGQAAVERAAIKRAVAERAAATERTDYRDEYDWEYERARKRYIIENPHCAQILYRPAADYFSSVEELAPRQPSQIPIYITPDSPRTAYTARPDAERSTLHWGQLKLLLSELKFLCDNAPADGPYNVVYAGAAEGFHIPFMAGLFPRARFLLYDPRQFCQALTGPGRPTNVEVNRQYFSENDAHSLSGLTDPTFFICDIRTGKEETYVQADMDLQKSWVRIIRPAASLLKFRLPWNKGKTSYLDGRILLPVYAPTSSTECRLLVTKEQSDAPEREYDNTEYEEQCAFHNTVGRVRTYVHDVSLPGLDHCHDCSMLVAVARQCLALGGGPADDANVGDFIKKMVLQIGTGRTLTSKPAARRAVAKSE